MGGRRPSVADLPRPEYARMVVSEAIRLYPPVHVLGRWAHEPDRFGTHVVPGNSMITFSPYLVHRHPEFWPEPERFDPERFRDPAAGGGTTTPTCRSVPAHGSASASIPRCWRRSCCW